MANISIADATEYAHLVDISILDVHSLLKEDVLIEEHQPLLTHLCSAVCCYKYILTNSLNDPMSIKNLNLSIATDNDNKNKNALRIKTEAIISARHILKDNDFLFLGVI